MAYNDGSTYYKFYAENKNVLENTTGLYCDYGRGFLIFYRDPQHTDTVLQFNLAGIKDVIRFPDDKLISYIEVTVIMFGAGLCFRYPGQAYEH